MFIARGGETFIGVGASGIGAAAFVARTAFARKGIYPFIGAVAARPTRISSTIIPVVNGAGGAVTAPGVAVSAGANKGVCAGVGASAAGPAICTLTIINIGALITISCKPVVASTFEAATAIGAGGIFTAGIVLALVNIIA